MKYDPKTKNVEYMEIMKKIRNADAHYEVQKARMLFGMWAKTYNIPGDSITTQEFHKAHRKRLQFLTSEGGSVIVPVTLENIKNKNFLERLWEKLCHTYV